MRIHWFVPMLLACGGQTSPADGGVDAVAEAEAGVDYGTCGKAAHDCICACDGGDCTSCYSTYPACTTCINDGVTSCCPNEYPAWLQCIAASQQAVDGGTAPCASTDTACQDAYCQSQASALQTCLGTSACKAARTACTGTCSP